jgi:Dyp-type peroxidase family
VIDRTEVQSLILAPSLAKHLSLHFLTLRTREHVRALAWHAADVVTTAATAVAPDDVVGHPSVHLGLTGDGVRLAGVPGRVFDALPSAFTRGMAHAAARLGDQGASGPECWASPFGPDDPPVHAVVLVADGAEPGSLAPYLRADRNDKSHPTAAAVRWTGDRRPDGTEVFGFRDGLSDPAIEHSGIDATPGNGVWDAEQRGWRPVATGEAVLGHRDESGAVAGHPDAAHLERDGSYLVVRKLQQHPEEFRKACERWATDLGPKVTPEAVAAGLVGRHKDGTVVGLDGRDPEANDFLYRDERASTIAVAPSAHIRRANPRDSIAAANAIVRRHVLFRRGIPYLDPPATSGAEREAGLLFLAICADLRRQFEFVQTEWLQDGNRFGLGEERDALVGAREGATEEQSQVSLGLDGVRHRRPLATFVTTRGGEYVLLPSRSALRLLGDLRDD